MTDTTIHKPSYMPGLDGLRALAVFAVIAYHMGLPFAPGGFLGVTLFFVLSGYLITDILLAEWTKDKKVNLKSFFVRRAKRLLPGVLFLLICLSAYITAFRPDLVENLKSSILPAMFFFSNWWYIFRDVPYFSSFATPSLLNHFWSLAVEAQFYIIWPFLLLFLQRLTRKPWIKITMIAVGAVISAALMAALYQPGFDPSRIYYGTDTRVFSLLLGACLAFVMPSVKLAQAAQKRRARVLSDLVGLIALLSILFMTYFVTQYDDFLYYGGMFLFSIASLLLIAAAARPSTIISKVFSLKPLRFIGKISYGIYLWQFPVIVITNTMVPSTKVHVTLSIFELAATVFLAAVSYYLIETPLRKKNIIKALRKNSLREFCIKCLQTRWWEKTAALLVLALVLVSGIGFLSAQAVPNDDMRDIAALPSELVMTPSNNAGDASPPPGISPSAAASPSPVSPTAEPANPTQSPDLNPSSTPDSPDATPSSTPAAIQPSDLYITVVGDSIAIDVSADLLEYFPNMNLDGKVGRQFYQAKTIIKQLIDNHELGPIVVIELGSNGAFSESQMRALIDLIGDDKRIVFVNTQVPRAWCSTVNSTLSKVSAEYDNTTVVDWHGASLDCSDYFYKDGFHPNSTGSPVLAKLIADAITEIQESFKP